MDEDDKILALVAKAKAIIPTDTGDDEILTLVESKKKEQGIVSDKSKRESLQEGVTKPRLLKNALSGIPRGIGESIDFPAQIPELAKAGLGKAIEWGIAEPDGLFTAAVAGMGGFSPPSSRKPTELLKKFTPRGQDFAEYIKPEFSEEEREASIDVRNSDSAALGLSYFQPLGALGAGAKGMRLAAMKSDALMAFLASIGERVGDTAGELTGAFIGALASLRKGGPNKLTKSESEAIDLVLENMGDTGAGETISTAATASQGRKISEQFMASNEINTPKPTDVGETISAVASRVEAGEIGTTADLARNSSMVNIEKALSTDNQSYIDELADKGRQRDAQISDEVTIPFRRVEGEEVIPPLRPRTDPKTGDAIPDPTVKVAKEKIGNRAKEIEAAADAEDARILGESVDEQANLVAQIDEVGAREIPSANPALLEAEQRARAAALRGEETVSAQSARTQADANLIPLRWEQIIDQVPEANREIVFAGIDSTNPKAAQEAANKYWRNDAFNEVKNAEKPFVVEKEVVERISDILSVPEIKVQFEEYLGKVVEATRRSKGIDKGKKLEFVDEDGVLDTDGYIKAIMEGEISGRQIMALRNYFAGSDVGNLVKWQLDDVIKKQLPPKDAAKYAEQMDIYTTHLTQRNLAEQNQTYLNRGEYTPEARTAAGKQYGRPGGQADIDAYQDIKVAEEGLVQATAGERLATAEAKTADAAASRAQRVEETASNKRAADQARLTKATELAEKRTNAARKVTKSKKDTDIVNLQKDNLAKYADSPTKFIREGMRSPRGSANLKSVYETMVDSGQKEAFRMEIARELQSSISDGSGRMLEKSASDFDQIRNNLFESGVLDGDGLNEIQKALEKTAVEQVRRNAAAGFKMMSETESRKVASSVIAALALNTTGSSSLILASTFKRAVGKALKNLDSEKNLVSALERIMIDPAKFVELASIAKTEKQATRLFLTQWVGAAQANAALTEE